MDNGDKIICRVVDIERKDHDIAKVEMDIDIESLRINDLYLYVNEVPDLNELKNNIASKFTDVDISVPVSNKLIIQDETYKIIVLKDDVPY